MGLFGVHVTTILKFIMESVKYGGNDTLPLSKPPSSTHVPQE
jgi:hypothetical protein